MCFLNYIKSSKLIKIHAKSRVPGLEVGTQSIFALRLQASGLLDGLINLPSFKFVHKMVIIRHTSQSYIVLIN